MKITDIKIEKFAAPLAEPFRVAFGVIENSYCWMVKVSTDEGIYGLGAAAPLGFVTGETEETCYLVLKMFAEALIGHDALDIAGAHAKMDQMIHGNGSSKCAIDIALHDIAGKAAGLPLYKLLGGTDPVVHNDITIGINPVEKMLADAEKYVFEKGFKILKVKIGNDLSHDIEVLTKMRKLVGEDVRIRIDANQGYDVPTALAAMKEFEKIGIDAAEQFLPWWDFDGAAELKRKNTSKLHLMLDESIHNVHDAKRAFSMDCADFYNIKLMKCGGLYWGAKIADFAEQHGVQCMVGCMQENKISITAGVSLVAAKKAIVEADCDSFMFYKGDDDGIEGGFTREGGVFTLLEKPGLGIDLDF
ncbi:MAG: dipeptide epimerase [Oscillospiraceae bacterium]|nr:dipeptide epimerase [Oscillospiraceae bacterium]